MIVNDLIEAAARETGVMTAGQTLATIEYTNSLAALNAILSGWTAAGLTVFQLTREQFTLTGPSAYTIGTSGTFNTARPMKIRAAAVISSAGPSMPAQVVEAERFETIIDRSVTGLFADFVACDYAFPQATIYLWPAPASGSLVLWSLKPLSSFTAVSDTVSLPPGYDEALKWNLALALYNELAGTKPEFMQNCAAQAQASRQAIERMNGLALGATTPPAGPAPQQPLHLIDIEQGSERGLLADIAKGTK